MARLVDLHSPPLLPRLSLSSLKMMEFCVNLLWDEDEQCLSQDGRGREIKKNLVAAPPIPLLRYLIIVLNYHHEYS